MILTADLSTLVGDVTPRRAELWITAPSVRVAPSAELYSGGLRKVPFRQDGTLSVELLDTDTPGTVPGSWQYRLQVRWLGGSLPEFAAELTGDTDLADVQPMDPADPVYIPAAFSLDRVTGLPEYVAGMFEDNRATLKGDKGDPGLDGSIVRVDATAGRAIYARDVVANRDQLIYGDTGWRDVSALAVNGWTGMFQIRRTTWDVHLKLLGVAGGTANGVWSSLAGFGNTANTQRLAAPTSTTAMGYGSVNNICAFGLVTGSTYGQSSQWTDFYWRTTAAWPTSLPGTPVGTIPNL